MAGINLICILILALYGLTDEIHQSFVPYRSATVIDLVKDVLAFLSLHGLCMVPIRKNAFQGLASSCGN